MSGPALRIDKWLWFARFARTRSLAAKLCEVGAVETGGIQVRKPHHAVRVGDRITIRQGRFLRQVTILALGERRGGAPEARLLYEEASPPSAVESEAWEPLLQE